MFTHSIRWRLQLWLGFLLVCVLAGFGATAYKLHRTNQLDQIDEELERHLAALRNGLRPHFAPRPGSFFDRKSGRPDFERGRERKLYLPPGQRPDSPPGSPKEEPEGEPRPGRFELRILPEVVNRFEESGTNGFYFTIWAPDGALVRQSTNAPPDVFLPSRTVESSRTHFRMRGYFREAFYFGGWGDCVLVGRYIQADLTAIRRFAWWLLAAGGLVLALGLGGGWWLTTHAIKPVEEISAAASRISAGNLAERIKVADPRNELGRLAGVLNSTFARLDAAFAQQKQFTADAAHELRTPLAVLISETQTALARQRSAAEYRDTVAACLDTAQQMRRLTESLLELARFDAGQERLHRTPLDLAETIRTCLERLHPLAEEYGIRVHCRLDSVQVIGDADRLSQVVTNLLSNAIYYNQPKGEIHLRTFAENGAAIFSVADTGQGISAEDLPHLFKRFYRADKARSAAAGRSGLGLAICQAIIDAHGGAIEVQSRPGVGTTFTVRLFEKN